MNSTYWENEGSTKTFTHELNLDWIKGVSLDTRVLDLGCGYGRISRKLYDIGYRNTIGFDPSKVMIARAESENPGPTYFSSFNEVSPHYFGLIICFALFTSCPEPKRQQELKQLIDNRTEASSWLYISDYLTSENPHYTERYQQRQGGIYGCFGSTDTVVFRHHQPDHFSGLFQGWREIDTRVIPGKTLNGNDINISQFIYRKANHQ